VVRLREGDGRLAWLAALDGTGALIDLARELPEEVIEAAKTVRDAIVVTGIPGAKRGLERAEAAREVRRYFEAVR
jgi:hypothetical protein